MRENFIHVSQVKKNDCGIACLFMILKYYGYDLGYAEIRDSLNLTSKGLSIENIVMFFKNLDIDTHIYRIKKDKLYIYNLVEFKKGKPIIALINDNDDFHYIVIYKMKKGKIVYSDPANDRISSEKNIELFNKIVLIIRPNMKRISNFRNRKRNFIVSNVLKQKKEIFKITCITFMSSVIGVILSSAFGVFIDLLENGNSNMFFTTLFLLLMFYLMLYFGSALISRIQNIISLRAIKSIEKDISSDLVSNILIQKYYDFKNYNVGEITSRINDCVSVSMTIAYFFLTILSDFIIAIFSIVFLGYINSYLTGIILISLSINAIITHLTYRKIYDMEHRNIKLYSKYYGNLVEVINGFEVIKTLCSEKFHNKRLNDVLEKYKEGSFEKEKYLNKISIFQNLVTALGTLFILYVGIRLVYIDELSLGNLAIFSTLTGILTTIISRLISFQFDFENYLIAYNRIIQMFRNNHESNRNEKVNLKSIDNIKIQNLSIIFDENIILENINLEINKKITLIQGESGSGKSSLVKVISGLDNHYTGDIIFNNKYNLKNIKRSSITYLSNSSTIFEGTIRDNLCQGVSVLDNHLFSLCEDFCVMELIQRNPDGLDYIIEPNQLNLSTGEKQRIALIRAILTEPSILILDEALSNIDEKNKSIILSNLCKLSFKILMITHEDIALPNSDVIIIKDKKAIYDGG